jgi:hypothetical protein
VRSETPRLILGLDSQIGSDIAVQAYAALGCQITRYIYSAVGYRYLYEDFRDQGANDFLYQLSLHGAQITEVAPRR